MLPLGRMLTLLTAVCAWGIPLGLTGSPRPPTPVPPSASHLLQLQSVQRSPVDSTQIRSQVEDAQADFERIRRRLLPYVWDLGSHPCEERVGRLCLWFGGEDEWEPLPDPPELIAARDDLLVTMADAADQIPADGWILGQRIRYMGEAGRFEDAVRLARACGGADQSWCSVLEGFALHGMGRYEAALEGFRRGLEAMDPEVARTWRDPSMLLDRKGSQLLEGAADENEWEKLRARVWTLADPLYLVAGNDRESEHYARWTFTRMNDGALNVWRMRWGDDLEELTVRYGWDRGWEQVRPGSRGGGGVLSVIGHHLPNGKEFAPPGRILEVPFATLPGEWVPEEERPRSAHVPPYAPTLLPGVAQVAVFHRGDSIVVAASTELPVNPDTIPGVPAKLSSAGDDGPAEGATPWPQPELLGGPEQFGLFLVDEGGRMRGVSRSVGEGGLYLTVPAGNFLLSVEAWAPEEGLGGRIRHGIQAETVPPDVATLSDLILLDSGNGLPRSLVSALPAMRPSTRIESSDQLVLGWEVFGLSRREEDVHFELSFSKRGEGFFGRLGRWLGIGGREVPLQLGWTEPGPSGIGPWFRSVEVTIPDVNPGEYVLRLGVRAPGREELVQTRLVEILP